MLLALAAGCFAAGSLGSALSEEIVVDGVPPENSEFIASFISSCIAETQKSWFAPSIQEAARTCSMRVRGLTVKEYVALSEGCLTQGERRWIFDLCASAIDKKLRPMMVPHKAPDKRRPEHPVGLTAADLAALEAGCDMVPDAGNKELCRSGIKKVKELILEPPEMQKD